MSEMAFHWAKTKVFAGQCSFQRLWESICVLAFSSSRSHLCPSARGPLLHLQSISTPLSSSDFPCASSTV